MTTNLATTLDAVFFKTGIVWETETERGHRLRFGSKTGDWAVPPKPATITIRGKTYAAHARECPDDPLGNKLIEMREVETATTRYDIYPEELE